MPKQFSHLFFKEGSTLSPGPIWGSTLFLSGLTEGSVLFAGASGLVTEDNPSLFYDVDNKYLGISTNLPFAHLTIGGVTPASGAAADNIYSVGGGGGTGGIFPGAGGGHYFEGGAGANSSGFAAGGTGGYGIFLSGAGGSNSAGGSGGASGSMQFGSQAGGANTGSGQGGNSGAVQIFSGEAGDANSGAGGNSGSVSVFVSRGGDSSSGNGGDAGSYNLFGDRGGNTNGTGAVSGGDGSAWFGTSGPGGNVTNASAGASSSGGDGGGMDFTLGQGGDNFSLGGGNAGNAQPLRFIGGAGGSCSGTGTAGDGSDIIFESGAKGTSVSGTDGNPGHVYFNRTSTDEKGVMIGSTVTPTRPLVVSTTGDSFLGFEISNQSGSNASAHAPVYIITQGSTGGDPYIGFQFIESEDTEIAMGLDNSDGDTFKFLVAGATDLDNGTLIYEIDQSGFTRFYNRVGVGTDPDIDKTVHIIGANSSTQTFDTLYALYVVGGDGFDSNNASTASPGGTIQTNGGPGGNSFSSGLCGTGGGISSEGGPGGTAEAGSTVSAAGEGGGVNQTGGMGGTCENANGNGGLGASCSFQGGDGGEKVDGTTSGNGGNGGSVFCNPGVGGYTGAASGDGGDAGSILLGGSEGGESLNGVGGAGSDVFIYSGEGGPGGISSGPDGHVYINGDTSVRGVSIGTLTIPDVQLVVSQTGIQVRGIRVENTTVNTSANARLALQTQSSSAGDPYTLYTVLGSTSWASGIDNSDSDKFKFVASSTPSSTTPALMLATNNFVAIGSSSAETTLTINQSSNVALRLKNSDSTTSYFQIQSFGTQTVFTGLSASSGSLIDINPAETAGTGTCSLRIFRGTNTTGTASVVLLRGDNSATTSIVLAANTAASATSFNFNREDIDFRVSGDTVFDLLFVNAGTDRIGIGTNSPDNNLEVFSSGITRIKVASSDNQAGISFASDDSNEMIIYSPDSSDDLRIFGTSDIMTWERATGDVGIGVTNPGTRLHVFGSSEIIRVDDSSATGNPYISFYQNGTRRSFIQHLDTSDTFRLASEYGDIAFYTGTGGAEVLRMTINSSGFAAINTTPSASYRLDVNGPIRGQDYYSGDGTQGTTTTQSFFDLSGAEHTVTVKDGLITSWAVA